jgi:predicted ATP-dependent serine protease
MCCRTGLSYPVNPDRVGEESNRMEEITTTAVGDVPDDSGLLMGALPGAGKTSLLNQMVAHAAVSLDNEIEESNR